MAWAAAPAQELAGLYPERWDHETMLDELKTHLRGPQALLRGQKPELVYQEFYALVMVHYAVRGLMHEAALREGGWTRIACRTSMPCGCCAAS